MQYSVTESLEVDENLKEKIIWGKTWPRIVIKLKSGREKLVDIIGSNHYSLVPGDKSLELKIVCKYFNIKTLEF